MPRHVPRTRGPGGPRTFSIESGARFARTTVPPVYQLAGGIVIPMALGGTQTTIIAKSGGVTSAASLGGAKNVLLTISRAGGVVSTVSAGGTRLVQIARTGGVVSPMALGGSKNLTASKSSGVVNTIALGGARLTLTSKSSGVSTPVSLGGAVLRFVVRGGGVVATLSLGASRMTTASKTAGTTVPTSMGGAKSYYIVVLANRGGGIAVGVSLGGVASFVVITPTAPSAPFFIRAPARRRPRQRPRVQATKKRQSHAEIAQHAERLLAQTQLPEYLSLGAQKAYENLQAFYGSEDGRRVFMKKAIEQGRGKTLIDKINDVYAKGTTVDTRQKLQTRVQVNPPKVTILGRKG